MEEYVNRCVVKFILSESKYGYIAAELAMYLNVIMKCSMIIHGIFYLKI